MEKFKQTTKLFSLDNEYLYKLFGDFLFLMETQK